MSCLNPFRAGRCLSTLYIEQEIRLHCPSQSLSSRAMSFDSVPRVIKHFNRLNPFRAGRCLSTHLMRLKEVLGIGLNPFRAGRCLSTEYEDGSVRDNFGLNPFRAGRCLSTINLSPKEGNYESQSLSSRAMSFDSIKKVKSLNS